MKENFQMIKNWYSVAKPKTKDYIWQFVTYIAHSVCFVIGPIFAAKATAVLAGYPNCDYNKAIMYLAIVFGLLFLRNLFAVWTYRNHNKVFDGIFIPLQQKIVDKVVNGSSENFKKFNKEKILNIYHTASYTIAFFNNVFI